MEQTIILITLLVTVFFLLVGFISTRMENYYKSKKLLKFRDRAEVCVIVYKISRACIALSFAFYVVLLIKYQL